MLTPIPLADLGADLDTDPEHEDLQADGHPLHAGLSPRLLLACGIVTDDTATLRLYRYDAELARWVPSKVEAETVNPATDSGVFEMRFTCAEISGRYALVQESGDGEVTYVFRPGQV